ncbi:VanZ family protein [Uliginosibacterium paludis]|uniref:VanZ family protein n=1 Tax=Uliginosibacterium paludis TaxID=1615952 RepID=A0ABV2CVA2_9RHOO
MADTVRKLSAAAASVLVLALFVLGSKPVAEGLFSAPWDKLAHLLYFALFAGLLHVGLGRTRRSALVGAVLLGMADEINQIWLPGRSASVGDFLADALGAALVLSIAWYIAYRRTA